MKIERGPYGKIAVFDLDQTLVLHALEVLQNQSCPCFLRANVREQFGHLQICYDCTGLRRLSEYNISETENLDQLRTSVKNLLLSLLEALDYCLSPSGIILDEEHIWIDPVDKSIYLTYFPTRLDTSSDQCNLTAIDTDTLDKLLGHSIFSQVIPTAIKQKLICSCQNNDERGFETAINKISNSGSLTPKESVSISIYTKYWASLLAITAIYGNLQLRIIFDQSAISKNADSFESLFFLFIPIALCAAALFHKQFKQEHSLRVNPSELKERRQVQAGIFFPDHCNETTLKSSDDYEQRIRPAYLIEQEEYGISTARQKKRRSFLVWVDDYLIGADKSLCDLYVNDDSVDLMHARILKRGHTYFLSDLGSSSGTWIGHQRLYSHEETPLNENDIIIIGNYRLLFSYSGNKD